MRDFGRYNEHDGHPTKPRGKVATFLLLWWDNIWSLIPLNVVFSFLHLLLIPGGIASAGMTYVTTDLARGRHSYGFSDFTDTVKRVWRRSLWVGIINLLITVFLLFVGVFYYTSGGVLATMGLGCCLMATMIFSFAKYYLWPQIVLFRLPISKVYKNAFLFVFLNFRNNLLVGLISLACYAVAAALLLLLTHPMTVALLTLAAVCVFPGFKQLLVQFCIFPSIKTHLIDPYYAEHPEEDLQLRKRLDL